MTNRARSKVSKLHRTTELLDAAEELALELGGMQYLRLDDVAERVGLHRTAMYNYFPGRDELLLELAERGWRHWRDTLRAEIGPNMRLTSSQTASAISSTLKTLPVFCDILTHTTLNLEADATDTGRRRRAPGRYDYPVERARFLRYAETARSAHADIVHTLADASVMAATQITNLISVSIILAADLWEVSHPRRGNALLFKQMQHWESGVPDFAPWFELLLEASSIGLGQVAAPYDIS